MGQQQIKDAFERNVRAISVRRSIARGTKTTRVALDQNLRCTVQDGDWDLVVDMDSSYAGDGTGPNPGVLARGAFGSCLAIGYAMWAARMGVTFDHLEVTVEADYDASGEFAVDDEVDPGYAALRYSISVASQASDKDVMRVLDTADRYSSIRDVFTRAIPVERSIKFLEAEQQ